MRRKRLAATALMVLAAVMAAVAGCGSKGYAPPLGKVIEVTLPDQRGTVTLTPALATHIAAYLRGQAIPYTGAATPVQVRAGGCGGKVVATLTQSPSTAPDSPAVQAAQGGGANVALAPDANWYVVVMDSNGPSAKVLACGNPLSDRRQYFNLYPPEQQDVAIGTALIDPITGTGVDLKMPAAKTDTTWAVRRGGCGGEAVVSGTVSAGQTQGKAFVFATPDASGWWISLGEGARATCVKAAS